MNGKIILLGVMCLIAGFIFVGVSFYFFLQQNKSIKKCGYISIALGFLTVIWGAMILLFPGVAALLALIYMFVLIFAFIVLYFMFKTN